VTLYKRFDFGWLFLFCGLVLTVAAIVLPARHDLEELSAKRTTISNDLVELEYRVTVYQGFLDDVRAGKPELTKRLIEMQFNRSPEGRPLVIDKSASQTPLAWVAQRAKRVKALPMQTEHASILSQFAADHGRLWLLGCGAFAMFIGLMTSSHAVSDS